jgi:hypothetical protein
MAATTKALAEAMVEMILDDNPAMRASVGPGQQGGTRVALLLQAPDSLLDGQTLGGFTVVDLGLGAVIMRCTGCCMVATFKGHLRSTLSACADMLGEDD